MIALIVAYDNNKLIGKDGKMPWHIKGELKKFRELTENNIVIMGRKTYESIGSPLKNRINIILSTNSEFNVENCLVFSDLEKSIDYAKLNYPRKDIYIIGGSSVYSQSLNIVDKMYITEIDFEYDGDTYFPEFNKDKFIKQVDEIHTGNPTYIYTTYIRK